jgi:hypothetical protein
MRFIQALLRGPTRDKLAELAHFVVVAIKTPLPTPLSGLALKVAHGER